MYFTRRISIDSFQDDIDIDSIDFTWCEFCLQVKIKNHLRTISSYQNRHLTRTILVDCETFKSVASGHVVIQISCSHAITAKPLSVEKFRSKSIRCYLISKIDQTCSPRIRRSRDEWSCRSYEYLKFPEQTTSHNLLLYMRSHMFACQVIQRVLCNCLSSQISAIYVRQLPFSSD